MIRVEDTATEANTNSTPALVFEAPVSGMYVLEVRTHIGTVEGDTFYLNVKLASFDEVQHTFSPLQSSPVPSPDKFSAHIAWLEKGAAVTYSYQKHLLTNDPEFSIELRARLVGGPDIAQE